MKAEAFEKFAARAKTEGFDEVIIREWTPNQVVAEHTHPFAAKALIVKGEMWLTVGDGTQHIGTGGSFALDPHVPHSERYGADGATYWVARRNIKKA
ncbi:MAG: AraC family ligand binding domain-containing protein [Pseudomonadota bacterium]|nr:AraC family ligand binding domain-containing protein [Pseudomonadota bacterium]